SARCDWIAACREPATRSEVRGTGHAASVPRPERTRKRALARFTSNKLVNPFLRPLLDRGLMPRTHALLETTGRKSGQPRRVPVGNGLRGDTFWIVSEHGYGADYV